MKKQMFKHGNEMTEQEKEEFRAYCKTLHSDEEIKKEVSSWGQPDPIKLLLALDW